MTNDHPDGRAGVLYGVLAYSLWGLFPFYWKALAGIPLWETLAHRVLWSLVTVLAALAVLRRLSAFYRAFSDPRTLAILGLSALLIGTNWSLYVLSVYTGQVLQASLGYYINPLINVGLGTLLLRERLSFRQGLAVGLAASGVLLLGWSHHGWPWLALGLAFSFAFYSLIKKRLRVEALAGLGVEALWLAPVAGVYLLLAARHGPMAFASGHASAWLLSTGPITLMPLVLFNAAARRLRLSTLGFIQYISPSIQLLVAVVFFHEPFGPLHWAAFGLIWTALALYSWESWLRLSASGPSPKT